MKFCRLVLPVFLVLLISMPLLAAGSDTGKSTENAQKNFQMGTELAQKGDFEAAKTFFKQAVDLDPSMEAMAHCSLGMAYSAKSRWLDAVAELQKAAKIRPDDIMIHFNLANAFQASGSIENTVEEYKRMNEINPKLDWARFNLGALYLSLNQVDNAIFELMEAEKLNPKLPMIGFKLGQCYTFKGKLDEAIAAYERSFKLNPKNHEIPYNIALIYMKKNDLDSAEKSFNKAIELKPDYAEAYTNIGVIYFNGRQKPDKAIPVFLKALEYSPNLTYALIGLSTAYKDTKDYESALKYAEKAKALGDVTANNLILAINNEMKK